MAECFYRATLCMVRQRVVGVGAWAQRSVVKRKVLVLSGNTMYGITLAGGSSNVGAVFNVNTDGTGFTTLYSFTGGSDGASPLYDGLILSGPTLYGTTTLGGSSGSGTVFSLSLAGVS